MFNQHQQFHQHLRQLQQLFQQQPPPPPAPPPPPSSSHQIAHPHRHQGGRPITAPPQAPPPHMVNLCSAPQATIIAANPMLQGALLMQQMQGNLRGFAVGGQQFTPFFPAGSRTSLLGPAPMGVAIKTPHMGFPPRHFHPPPRYLNKDLVVRQPERKHENEIRVGGTVDGQSGPKSTEGEGDDRDVSTEGAVVADRHTPPLPEMLEEPALKKQRTEGSEGVLAEPPEANGVLSSDYKHPAGDQEPGDAETLVEGGSMAGPETMEFMEESRAAEVLGVGASLKVTIQQSSESRAFSTGGAKGGAMGTVTGSQGEAREVGGDSANKFFCYICSITCHNQQSFQSHMTGLPHQQRMMEIQHKSNACLVTLLPRVRESLQSTQPQGERRLGVQRWCATCQTHFSGNLIEHRRTKEHKLSKHSSRPFCTVCKRHFRTPRKFVEHMKSPEHKQRVEELREEGGPEVLEELITVDAVGCFEGEEDYEEEPNEEEEEEEEGEQQGHAHSQVGLPTLKEVSLEDMGDDEEYDSDTQYGSCFVVPVAGFLCRLCHKFFHFESTARLSHCKSLTHFQNLQKYRALRSREEAEEPDSCSSVEDQDGVRAQEEETTHPDGLAPNHLTLSVATPSPCSQGRVAQSPVPSTGHASHSDTLTCISNTPPDPAVTVRTNAPPRPRPSPRDHALEPRCCEEPAEDLPRGDTPTSSPPQTDFPEKEEWRQGVLGQQAPQGEGREEEEDEEDDAVADVEAKPATGCRRTASRRRGVRTTRRR